MTTNPTASPSCANSQSRSKLVIEARRVKFDFHDIETPFFYNGNAFISALWVALSSTFPVGEAEFIRSVRLFENKISDPKLLGEVNVFTAQEAHHSLQHKQLNKSLQRHGYQTQKIGELLQERINHRIENWAPERRLARTVVAEHVTAIISHYLLTNSTSNQMPDSFRDLFQWHAIEEIEHKSVAFDVYKHCVGDQKLLRKEFRRFSYFDFPKNIFFMTKFLLREIGYKVTWKERKEVWRYLFGAKGLISRSQRAKYMMFMKDGFHPWNHDDSALVEEWKVKLSL